MSPLRVRLTALLALAIGSVAVAADGDTTKPDPAKALAEAAKKQVDSEKAAVKARFDAQRAALTAQVETEKLVIDARQSLQLANLIARAPTQAANLETVLKAQASVDKSLLQARLDAQIAVIDQQQKVQEAAIQVREAAATAAALRGGGFGLAGPGVPLGLGGFGGGGVVREVTTVEVIGGPAPAIGLPAIGVGSGDVLLRLNKRLYHPTYEAVERYNRADYPGACHHLSGALSVVVPELKRYATEGAVPVELYQRVERDYWAAGRIASEAERVIVLRAIANDIAAAHWRARESADGRSYLLERLGGEPVLVNVSRHLATALSRDSGLRLADGSDALVPSLLTTALFREIAPGVQVKSCYPAGVSRGQVVSVARLVDDALRANSVPEYEIREVWSRHQRHSPYRLLDD